MSPAVFKGAHADRMAPFALGLARLPPNGEAVHAAGRESAVYVAKLLNVVTALQIGIRDAEHAQQQYMTHGHPVLLSYEDIERLNFWRQPRLFFAMFAAWGRASQESSDELSHNATDSKEDDWPPRFKSYDAYKAEMDALVNSHPPFGAWLRRYRNVNHVVGGGGAFDGMEDVEALKERFLREERARISRTNARRYMCELHLSMVDVESDETAAYQQEMERWKEKVVDANGRSVVPKPKMPGRLSIKSAMGRVLRQMTECDDADPLGPGEDAHETPCKKQRVM